MSDIKIEVKEAIENFKIGKTANFSNKQLITWLSCFLTTIESQKEEIENLKQSANYYVGENYKNFDRLNLQKDITELAVKGLKRIANITDEVGRQCPKCKGEGFHHGFGETGHDPDYCTECGGLREVYDTERTIAESTLSEIERLSQ